jgi:hypothetical protein
MDTLFVAAIFVVAVTCGAAIMVVACLRPEGSDAQQTADVPESQPLEAPVH